ncbi:MAG: hypothetical protein NWE89_01620 [Candidatus Bathyarchaeota archaeon]|nr:hypothetical protein [Candidatus Bathyarchaeota archaeon]
MKIGNLEFRDYAAKKPITITPTGDFVKPEKFLEAPPLALGSMLTLGNEMKTKLTVERLKLEPDFDVGILGVGQFSKAEVIENVESQTELGEWFIRIEMNYLDELQASLAVAPELLEPEIPKFRAEAIPKDWKWIPKEWWKRWWKYFRMCALFCENTTDHLTKIAVAYRMKHVHPLFVKRRFCIKVLKGIYDTRAYFVPKAKSWRVSYISGVGHGSPTTYTGHLGDPILKKSMYDSQEVKDKVIHLLSCQTAKELGPDLVKKGAKAYAGYHENFIFSLYDDPDTPFNDADLFWRSDSAFDIMMALGRTVEEAHNVTIAVFNYCINLVPNTSTAAYLTHDRNYFRSPVNDPIYGDKTAKIYPWIQLPVTPFLELEEAIPELAITE